MTLFVGPEGRECWGTGVAMDVMGRGRWSRKRAHELGRRLTEKSDDQDQRSLSTEE